MPTRIAIVDDKQINRTTVKDKVTAYKEIEMALEAKNDFHPCFIGDGEVTP